MAAGDTALWLHNKLGSTDDLWSGKIICSQLSRERLLNIQDCFHTLQSHVKVKLLLSFLHIPKRNIEQWQQDLEEIILLGINDTDPWVATVGEIMREFPSSGALLLVEQDTNSGDSNMAACLEEVKNMVQKCNMSMMPLECQYLNKASLSAVAGQIPEPSKHFTIKRRPKSAALRAEIIQKSSETVLNKRNHTSSSVIKSRSFAKKMDTSTNFTPLKMTPGRSPFSSSDYRSPGTPLSRTPLSGRSPITPLPIASRSSSKKDSKIKLLEIEEMPVGAKEAKRRKKIADMEALEAQKKEKEALAAAAAASGQPNGSGATSTTTVTPDYAAGLIPSAPPKMPMTVLSVSNPALPQPSPAYLPSSARQNTQSVTITSNLASSLQPSTTPNLSEQLKQHLLQPQTRTATITASPLSSAMAPILISQQQPSSVVITTNLQQQTPTPQVQTISSMRPTLTLAPATTPIAPSSLSPLVAAAPMVGGSRPAVVVQQAIQPLVRQPQVLAVRPFQPQQSTSQPVQTQQQQPSSSGVKTGLSLTKDQMLEAQEMFRVSNKVSRPEKALILGFMAGSRENPCAQRGNILNIKLSEKEEVVLLPDGTKKRKIEDTIFQMNYATGEWKQFLNLREMDVS